MTGDIHSSYRAFDYGTELPIDFLTNQDCPDRGWILISCMHGEHFTNWAKLVVCDVRIFRIDFCHPSPDIKQSGLMAIWRYLDSMVGKILAVCLKVYWRECFSVPVCPTLLSFFHMIYSNGYIINDGEA